MTNGSITRRDFIAGSAAAGVAIAISPASASLTNLVDLSIAQVSNLIRTKTVSPVDLTRAYLERIERLNPALNAFVTVTSESAIEAARKLESEIMKGEYRGPLHGIPIGLKDNIDTAGVRTTGGSALFADRVPTEDAEVSRRLKMAGAIVVGKCNMHEFAFGDTTSISNFGPTHNPWNLNRVPGGSSGGSAAAVAAQLCAGALGTDTGGSIRQPAAFCGIVGVKPTYGLVSIRGIIPLAATQDHVGPMCRTVADTAIMLQTLAGYDARDLASIKAKIPNYLASLSQRVSSLRLGIPREFFFDELNADIATAVEEAIDVLRRLTAGTTEIPSLPQTEHRVVHAEAYEYHANYIRDENLRRKYQGPVLERLITGSNVPTDVYIKARREQTRVRREIANAFRDVDVIVTPTTPDMPVTISEGMNPSNPLAFSLRNTAPFDAYGIPTITVPCGLSREGLPIGLQISTPHLGEAEMFALAQAFERETEWHKQTPTLA